MRIIAPNSNIYKSLQLLTGTKEAGEWLKSMQDELVNLLVALKIPIDPENSGQIGGALDPILSGGGLNDEVPPTPAFDTITSGISLSDSTAWIIVNWHMDSMPSNFSHYLLRHKPVDVLQWKTEITTDSSYKIEGIPPNTDYEFQVRSVTRLGSMSEWSPSTPLIVTTPRDNIPPDAPSDLIITPGYSTIIAQWSPNTEEDLNRYEVYYSTDRDFVPDTTDFTNRKYVGNTTIVSIPISRAYNMHYVQVCAIDKSNNRSTFSFAEASVLDADPLAPEGLDNADLSTGITIDSQGNSQAWIKIEWIDGVTRGSEFSYYEYSVRNSIDHNSLTISGTRESSYTFQPVLVGATYWIKARAVGATGAISNWSNEATIIAAVDTIPPAKPTNINGKGGVGIIFLSWTNPTDADFDHIEIYRNDTNSVIGATRIAAYITGSFYFDSTVEEGTTYTYFLKSYDWSKNESDFTDGVTVTPASVRTGESDLVAPAIPENIQLTTGIEFGYSGVGFTWIKVEWDKVQDADLSYYEYRIRPVGGEYKSYKTINNFDTVRNVPPGANFEVSVRAVDINLNASSWSYPNISIISAQDETIPKAPTNLYAVDVLKNIVLAWSNPTLNIDESLIQDFKCIEVYRSDTNDRLYATLIATTKAESYVDAVGTYDVTRYYWIRAVDQTNNASDFYPLDPHGGISCTTISLMAEDVTAPPVGYDMTVNADFDHNLTGWELGSVGTLPNIVEVVGGKSGKYAIQSQVGLSASIITSKKIPIDTSKPYIVESYFRAISSGSALLTVKLFDENGTEMTYDTSDCWFKIYEGVPSATFEYHSGAFGFNTHKPFPPASRFIQIECRLIATNQSSILQAQGIRLREIIEGVYIGDAAIKSAHIAEAQILDAHIVELVGDKIKAGIIQSLDEASQLNLNTGQFSLKETFVWDGDTLLIGDAQGSKIYWDGTKLHIDGELEIGSSSPVATKKDISYRTEIESTNGDKFTPGKPMSSYLIAHVFQGTEEVTDQIDASRFKWRRVSYYPQPYPNDDATWNEQYKTGYKQIMITTNSVESRATFHCDIMSA